MLLHKLERAIEKGWIVPFLQQWSEWPDSAKPKIHELLENQYKALGMSQRFILDADEVSLTEVNASAIAMKEAGVLHLPFDFCYTEVKTALVSSSSDLRPIVGRLCLLSFKNSDHRLGFDCDFRTTLFFNLPELHGKTHFAWLPGSIISGAYNEYFQPIAGYNLEPDATKSIVQSVGQALRCLLVLLQTKGAEREFVPTGKTSLISRDFPVNGYTIVRNYHSRDSSGRRIEERKRVRLHLRRGHVRRQRWGRGRKYEKIVWIEPMLVGHEEEGRIEHTYEVD